MTKSNMVQFGIRSSSHPVRSTRRNIAQDTIKNGKYPSKYMSFQVMSENEGLSSINA